MPEEVFKIIVLAIVIGIPGLGVMVWGVTDSVLKHRRQMLEMQAQLTAEKAAQYAAKTERIDQRLRVLERIVTDKGLEIADEIENLRDRPLN